MQSIVLGVLNFCDEREKEKSIRELSSALPPVSFAMETIYPKYSVLIT